MNQFSISSTFSMTHEVVCHRSQDNRRHGKGARTYKGYWKKGNHDFAGRGVNTLRRSRESVVRRPCL